MKRISVVLGLAVVGAVLVVAFSGVALAAGIILGSPHSPGPTPVSVPG
jgi:hypothetical protein